MKEKENPININCILVISLLLLLQFAQYSTALPPQPPSKSENPSPVQSNHLNTFLLTVILVSVIVLMAFAFVYVHYHYFVGPRLPRTASALAATGGLLAGGGDSLDADVLNTFPTFVYSEVKALKIGMGGLECAVCLNEFEDDETLRLIPHCSHAFHSDCIDKWLSSHVTCPVCRADVTNVIPLESKGVSREKSARETSSATSEAGIDEIVIPIEYCPIPSRFTTKISGRLDHVVASGSGGKPVVKVPGEEWDRYTLRLPEEVQSRLMRSRMNRTRSCVVFGRAKSGSRKEEIKMGLGSVGQGRVYKNFLFSEQSD